MNPSDDLPTIVDCTRKHPDPKVVTLVRRAIGGLGFRAAEGPRKGDLMFVGDQVMGWIDRTGFFGKLNGLWALDGVDGDLDFTVAEPVLAGEPRPVSVLLPGEDGDGRWPAAYNGGEHYEIPRFVDGQHVAQAGQREANHFAATAPSTWRQCINANAAPARWDEELGTNDLSFQADHTVRVTNRAPLAIVARFSAGAWACGSEFPFNNNQPGRMELTAGYVFDPRGSQVERLYQLHNHSAHDYRSQSSVDKLIGGILLTDWPRPHYLKQFHLYGSWDTGTLAREARYPWAGTGQTQDFIDVKAAGTRWLSATPTLIAGRSIRIEQLANGIGDVGTCQCRAHGGFELGGSVLANLALPPSTRPGSVTESPVHWRTLYLDGDRSTPVAVTSHVLQAEADVPGTIVRVGARDGTAWTAAPGDAEGLMYYGTYLKAPGRAVGQASFVMAIDAVDAADEPVLVLDVLHDASAVIANREIRRSEFHAAGKLQRFVLDFQVPADGTVEPRVRWLGRAATRLDGIVVNWLAEE